MPAARCSSARQTQRCRCRIRFGKNGPLRYTSHLDLVRIWERTLRRAGVPLIYSQGFNPRPKIQLAAALPLGYASTAEVLDIWITDAPPSLEALLHRLRETAPEGLSIDTITTIDWNGPALQTLTHGAAYEVLIGDEISREELETRIGALLTQPKIMRERRGKRYDLRPLIHKLEIWDEQPLHLKMVLTLSQKDGTGRPDEILDALGLDAITAKTTRTAIFLSEGS